MELIYIHRRSSAVCRSTTTKKSAISIKTQMWWSSLCNCEMFINSKLLQQNHFPIIMHGRTEREFLFKAYRVTLSLCKAGENIKNWSFLRREKSVLALTYSTNFSSIIAWKKWLRAFLWCLHICSYITANCESCLLCIERYSRLLSSLFVSLLLIFVYFANKE